MLIETVTEVRQVSKRGQSFAATSRQGRLALRLSGKFSEADRKLFAFLKVSKNPSLSRVHEFGEFKGKSYVLSEWVQGVSVAACGKVPVPQALGILRSATAGLAALYAEGLFHGDISPSNLVVSTSRVAWIDLGLASGIGTAFYAAPERFGGERPSARSELFSLGMLLYKMVAGRLPNEGMDFEGVAAFALKIDSWNPLTDLFASGEVPPEGLYALEKIWKGTLRATPADRFEDFDELLENLEIAEGELGSQASEAAVQAFREKLAKAVEENETFLRALTPEKFGGRKSQSRLYFIAAGVLLVCILAAIIKMGSASEPSLEETGRKMLIESRAGASDEGALQARPGVSDQVLQALPVPEGAQRQPYDE